MTCIEVSLCKIHAISLFPGLQPDLIMETGKSLVSAGLWPAESLRQGRPNSPVGEGVCESQLIYGRHIKVLRKRKQS